MKKITFILLVFVISLQSLRSQTTLYAEAPAPNTTSQQRAPNGTAAAAFLQACSLVLASELSIIPATSTITQFGFTLSTGTGGSAATGNFTVYLQNTTDVTYNKGTTWSTITTGMTNVYASVMTVPLTANTTSIILTLSTPFVYTGGGLYVAYDWASTGPFATTPATYLADGTGLNPGTASGFSTAAAPTLSTSPFRPTFLFGLANPYTNDVKIIGVESPGMVPAVLNAPHNVRALVKNSSNTTLTNINVNMTVAGANAFTDTQIIPSLAAGSTQMVTFAAYNPQQPGPQTVSVTVPSDQFNGNNMATFPQSVTCNFWGRNPAAGSYTTNSVGFATGAGLLFTPMTMPVNTALIGVRGAISTNTPTIGNSLYGVLVSGAGLVIATTNTVVITSGMLGTFVSFYFATPPPITALTNYYIGFAQTANSIAYHPAGTQWSQYLPSNLYYYTGIGGGTPVLLTQNFGYFGLEAMFQHTVTISAASQTIACGNTTTLNALSSTNYSWSTGALTSSIVVTPTVNAQYSVSATNTLGCTASTIVNVAVTPIPLTIVSNPTVACVGIPMVFTASGASSYTWATPQSTTNSNVLNNTPSTSANYTLTGSNPNGCSATNIVPVTVNALPVINISNVSPTICLGNSVVVTAVGNSASYSWDLGPTTASISLNPLSTTVYSVTGTSAAGCTNIKTMTVNVISFTPGITTPTSICQGQSIVLTATGATTLLWDNGSVFSSITVTPAVTTNYSVTAKGLNGCIGTNSTTIAVNNNPTITAVATRTSICRKESTTITASGASTYSWSTGATDASVVVTPTANVTYVYLVTGYNANGCEHTIQVSVKVNACTGIEEFSGVQISLFPNPVSESLTLSYPGLNEEITIEIYNAAGQKVQSTSTSQDLSTLDISQVSPGVYQLNVIRNNQVIKTSRIIKQ